MGDKTEPFMYFDCHETHDTITMVYLAGPIDAVDKQASMKWRDLIGKILNKEGISCFDPARAYKVGNAKNAASRIMSINEVAMNTCDVVLVNLSNVGSAFGTIREIEKAKMMGKRVIVAGNLESHLAAYDLEVYINLDIAVQVLIKDAQDLCKLTTTYTREIPIVTGLPFNYTSSLNMGGCRNSH